MLRATVRSNGRATCAHLTPGSRAGSCRRCAACAAAARRRCRGRGRRSPTGSSCSTVEVAERRDGDVELDRIEPGRNTPATPRRRMSSISCTNGLCSSRTLRERRRWRARCRFSLLIRLIISGCARIVEGELDQPPDRGLRIEMRQIERCARCRAALRRRVRAPRDRARPCCRNNDRSCACWRGRGARSRRRGRPTSRWRRTPPAPLRGSLPRAIGIAPVCARLPWRTQH